MIIIDHRSLEIQLFKVGSRVIIIDPESVIIKEQRYLKEIDGTGETAHGDES